MIVLLLDAYNLLFRSFTSLPQSITSDDGRPINAVYGLLAFIVRLIRELQPSSVIAAFDIPEVPTFRHQLYPAYQGQRGPLGGEQADEFARQVGMARELLPRMSIPAMSYPGYEADDVMGTLAVLIAGEGGRAILVSTDRDLLQLVGNGVEALVPGKELLHIDDAEGAQSRLGVLPQYVTTFKALAGDASDNIPGLPGIGTKTAIQLVGMYGDLDSICRHLDDLPPRIGRILSEHQEEARLFQRVVTIRTDLDVGIDALPTLEITADDRPRELIDRAG